MKKLILFFLLALSANALSLTTVTWTVAGVGNTPAVGSAAITLTTGCTWNGTFINPNTLTVQIIAGAFTTSLVPNDSCTVQGGGNTTQYNVVWTINGQKNALLQTWYVPSGGPFTVPNVLASAKPPQQPQQMISPAQISQYGATLGQALTWLGNNYGPATGGGGGGLVSSVFGRIGAILAQSGDYTCAQITGCGLTLQNSGSTIGSGLTTLNVQPDTSTIVTTSVVGSTGNVKYAINTAAVPNIAMTQAGVSTITDTGAGGTSYAGCPSITITTLTNGMHVTLIPAHASTGGATTFNLCTLGAVSVLGWGTSNPSANDFLVNRPVILRYDSSFNGGAWVYTPDGTAPSGGGGSPAPLFNTYANRPACAAGNTGQTFTASEVSNKYWACDGTTWQPVAFGMQVVEPTALTWTPAGSGAVPTITSVAGALVVTALPTGSWQVGSTPISLSPPYTIEVVFTYSAGMSSGAWNGCGLALFSSTPPSFSGQSWMAWFIAVSPTVGVAQPTTTIWFLDEWQDVIGSYSGEQVVPVIREKLVDDGTNRTFYLNNGAGYLQVYQGADNANNTPYLPAYWGVGCGNGNGGSSQLVLYSASVHH